MLVKDVFLDDSFSAIELTEAVSDIVYIPQDLAQMNLFEVEALRTTRVAIRKRSETLELVPYTERGAPETRPGRDTSTLRDLTIPRLAQEDRIEAHEIQDVVNEYMPFDVALMRAVDEIDRRQEKLLRNLELTREYARFTAMNGILLDANGQPKINYFAEFGLPIPTALDFNFSTLVDGELRAFLAQNIVRPMMKQLRGRKTPSTRVGAFCGDEFYDELIKAKEVRDTYLGHSAAAELRGLNVWDSFNFGGVEFRNFQGTDDDTTIAIAPNEVRFFPIGARDVFKEYRAPGEDFEWVNTPGREVYSILDVDPRPNRFQYAELHVYAYPLFACIGPDVLLRGEL